VTARTIPFVDLAAQYRALRGQIDRAVGEVLAGGNYILGERLERFEAAFAAHLGGRHAVGVASGTDAVELRSRTR
jgi:dTDP-4-amino-4,6-dideoxygalactose transaminase